MCATLSAQDIHFSQFYENPSLTNPALTGASGSIRASLNNRDQWRSVTTPYKTFGFSLDSRLKKNDWQQVDKYRFMTFKEKSLSGIAAGLSFYTDKAGDGNLGMSQCNVSLASSLPLNQNNFFTVGLQGCLTQRKLDRTKLLFPNQYNGTIYDPNKTNKENFSVTNFVYGDASAGVLWSYIDKEKMITGNKQMKANIGFSVYHLVKPNQKYLANFDPLYMKYVLHGDMATTLRDNNVILAPSFLTQLQGRYLEILVGTQVRYVLNNDSKYTGLVKQNSVGFGVHYRNRDALILSGLINWKEQYAVVMSYDLNISPLLPTSYMRGGFEITLRYTNPDSYLYQKKKNGLTEITN